MFDILYTYEDFLNYPQQEGEKLFFIIEYKAAEATSPNRYSLMRNEILAFPLQFKERLNNGVYRIWTRIPYDTPWK